MLKQLCVCDECNHVWLAPEVPKRCANCKSRAWNGKKSTGVDYANDPAVMVTVVEPVEGHNPTPGLIPVREVTREELEEEYPRAIHMGEGRRGVSELELRGAMEFLWNAGDHICTGDSDDYDAFIILRGLWRELDKEKRS